MMTAATLTYADEAVRHILATGIGLGAAMTNDRLARFIDTGGGLGGVALARTMMTHLGDDDTMLRGACADAIARCDGWESLLAELLADVELGAAVDVAARALAVRQPDHPLARLEPPLAALAAFDLNGRGTRLRMPAAPLPTEWREAMLIGVDRPSEQTAVVAALTLDDEWLNIELDSLHDWIEPHRTACPGCALIVA